MGVEADCDPPDSGPETHTPARRVDPAARAVTALGSRGLLASLRGACCTKSLFDKVSKFVAAFGAQGVRNRVDRRANQYEGTFWSYSLGRGVLYSVIVLYMYSTGFELGLGRFTAIGGG